jgi:hypothetical protein
MDQQIQLPWTPYACIFIYLWHVIFQPELTADWLLVQMLAPDWLWGEGGDGDWVAM